jgi:hypothetical protein
LFILTKYFPQIFLSKINSFCSVSFFIIYVSHASVIIGFLTVLYNVNSLYRDSSSLVNTSLLI